MPPIAVALVAVAVGNLLLRAARRPHPTLGEPLDGVEFEGGAATLQDPVGRGPALLYLLVFTLGGVILVTWGRTRVTLTSLWPFAAFVAMGLVVSLLSRSLRGPSTTVSGAGMSFGSGSRARRIAWSEVTGVTFASVALREGQVVNRSLWMDRRRTSLDPFRWVGVATLRSGESLEIPSTESVQTVVTRGRGARLPILGGAVIRRLSVEQARARTSIVYEAWCHPGAPVVPPDPSRSAVGPSRGPALSGPGPGTLTDPWATNPWASISPPPGQVPPGPVPPAGPVPPSWGVPRQPPP